jgi:aryl-alcohol dehydrogenase-like predicted oxidoreductase
MDYRILGRSGLRVSQLCLGTMTFGTAWGWGADRDESRQMFDAFVAEGGNFVDTASNYTEGESEQIVGELAAPRRDSLVLATKYTLSLDRHDPNAGGNHRKSLVRALEQSLRRLRTDYVDLLWLHMYDAHTPIDEAVRALDDQVRLGKVLHVGISDSPAWVIAQARTLAELRGWTPFTAVQLPYNLLDRDAEREVLPMAEAHGLAVTPWGVLEQGVLAGKSPSELRWPTTALSDRAQRAVDAVTAVATARGVSPAQVAIAWMLARPFRATIVPIVAARRAEQLRDNLAATAVQLSADEVAQLDAAAPVALGFPRAFLESDGVRELIYGDTFLRIR